MQDRREQLLKLTRRQLFQDCRVGIGAIALASLIAEDASAAGKRAPVGRNPLAPKPPHFPAKAKRVIFLHMAGGPSHLDLYDPKPKLRERNGESPPESFVKGKRFAFLKPTAKLLGSPRRFFRHGKSGMEFSELLPKIGALADDICLIRSMRTDVFNHGPAKMFSHTGSPRAGRPSMGAWLTYGLGSVAKDLPGFVVLQSGPRGPRSGAQLWSSGFLPTTYQGVPFHPGAEPILDLKNPPGIDRRRQRDFFDAVRDLNRARLDRVGEPEIATRIAAYEIAYKMQVSAPELMDISQESAATLALYGAEAGQHSFANNCLLARRLIERGVRYVQLYHTDWDHHGGPNMDLGKPLERICRKVDQPCAALIRDLKQRGLLKDTLIIWAGEFGRTPMGEPRETMGRDHHIEAYSVWLAGGGVRGGAVIGKTDDFGFQAVEDPVHVHDLHETLLHLLGLHHKKLTYRFQGRDFRLTDVHGEVVEKLLA